MTSYPVKNSLGSIVCAIPDNSVNTSATSLSLLGQGTVDFGLEEAENWVRLLENFANVAAPSNAIPGQLWYDTSSVPYVLKIWDGGTWQDPGNAFGQSNLPNGGTTVGGNVGEGVRVSGSVNIALAKTLSDGIAQTSIVVIVSEGRIVAAICEENIPVASLPTTLAINGIQFGFSAGFPNGLTAGQTLANDTTEYAFYGVFKQSRDPVVGNEVATKNYTDAAKAAAIAHTDQQITAITPFLVPPGLVAMWSGAANAIPAAWVLCNGQNNTPDLRDRFVVGAGTTYQVGDVGGNVSVTPNTAPGGGYVPSGTTSQNGAHDHGGTESYTLGVADIPPHGHSFTIWPAGIGVTGPGAGPAFIATSGYSRAIPTQNTGGGGPHSHRVAMSANHGHTLTINAIPDHLHAVTVNVLPPYYALCFIMKV